MEGKNGAGDQKEEEEEEAEIWMCDPLTKMWLCIID